MKHSFWSLLAALSFALMALFIRLGASGLTSMQLVFVRSAFTLLAIYIVFVRGRAILKTPFVKEHAIRCVCGITAMLCWFYAIPRMNFGLCMALVYTTPLFLAAYTVIRSLVSRSAVPWGPVAGAVVGFTGVALCLGPSFHAEELFPAFLCIFSAFLDLLSFLQIKKMGEAGEPSWRIVFFFSLFGALVTGIGFVDGVPVEWTPMLLACLAGIGITASVGQWAGTQAYAAGNMLLSACLGLSAIVFSLFFSALVFNEPVTAGALLGTALIIAGSAVSIVTTRRWEMRAGA